MRSLMAAFFGLWAGPAAAFCGTYVSSPGVELTNQTSQIIITRQGTRTTLSMANDYSGPLDDFAMLVPVPEVLSESDIQTVRPELFQRFDNYSAPRIVSYECSDFEWDYYDDGWMDGGGGGYDDGWEEGPPDVVVEAEYSVGIYDIVILSATTSGGLLEWLTSNGYGVDPAAEDLLGEYIDSGSYFFAAQVDADALSFDEEGATILEPLQFGYESSIFSLPIRLGTINSPGEQDVVMYIITDEDDGAVGISNYTEITVEDECMVDFDEEGGVDVYYGTKFAEAWAAEDGEGWLQEYAWRTSSCDPCPTDSPDTEELEEAGYDGYSWESYFTRIRLRYTPDGADEDVMLYTSGISSSEQIRYIIYNSEMEDRYPVCGWGMVDEPGTCDDDEDGTDIWEDPPDGDGGTSDADDGASDADDGASDADDGASDADDGASDADDDDSDADDDNPAPEDDEWDPEDDDWDADGDSSDGAGTSGGLVDDADDDDDADDKKSGCSSVGSVSGNGSLVWLLGAMCLFGRRRSTHT